MHQPRSDYGVDLIVTIRVGKTTVGSTWTYSSMDQENILRIGKSFMSAAMQEHRLSRSPSPDNQIKLKRLLWPWGAWQLSQRVLMAQEGLKETLLTITIARQRHQAKRTG